MVGCSWTFLHLQVVKPFRRDYYTFMVGPVCYIPPTVSRFADVLVVARCGRPLLRNRNEFTQVKTRPNIGGGRRSGQETAKNQVDVPIQDCFVDRRAISEQAIVDRAV